VLALSPLHTHFAAGQLTLMSLALGLLGWWGAERGRSWGGGIAMGLGLVLKPQIGLVVLVFSAYRRQWRTALLATVVAAAALGVGAIRLQMQGMPWLSDLRANLHDNAHGGSGDPTRENPLRFQLLNLHYPLHNFSENRRAVSAAAFLVPAAASAAGLILALRAGRRHDLLLLGLWFTASLLVAYHRAYDAVVLVVSLAWLVSYGWRVSRAGTVVAAAALLAFLTPGPAMLNALAERGLGWESLIRSAAWQHVILPHQVWALLVVLIAHLWLLARADHEHPASVRLR
jgi:hypothetical protein